MVRATVVGFVLMASAGAAADPAPQAAVPLRVLSYNIHHGEGTDRKLDLGRVAAVIAAQKPDLVAVQEVDRGTARTGGVDQATALGKLTGLHAGFAKAITYQGGEYGQAVLSRHPFKLVKVHPLPGKPNKESRVVAEARVELPGGKSLTFLATHLAHDDAGSRAEQVKEIDRLFAKADGPTILAGDLNAVPDSEPITALAQSWAFATPRATGLLTIPAGDPKKQIDYVLYRPAARFRAVEAKVVDEKVASDHRPVLAVVDLLP